MMEFAKKRDEEVKQAKVDLEKMQAKLTDEEQLRQRDKTLLMQKDNKIRMLEVKIGDQQQSKPQSSAEP